MKRLIDAGTPPASPLPSSNRRNTDTTRNPFPSSAQDSGSAEPHFAAAVIDWQKAKGRHQLPWQGTRDAYRVWLSEIMLQQTQVAAVIPYYQRFLQRFRDLASLAAAPADEVMAHWSGLGYYSRARNLHRCAQRVCAEYGGAFPQDPALLEELPGIGRSTAAAIAAFSFGRRAAILDGNVKRVFCRYFGIEAYPGQRQTELALWQRAEVLLPMDGIESYTQGLMDLGATVCTRGKPACEACPLREGCVARATDRVAQLPLRKPKKLVPERHTAMLIALAGDRVLLQQRPNHGIWGGLLSLPEFEPEPEPPQEKTSLATEALEQVLRRFGTAASCRRLARFSHTFTHFKLHVEPWLVTLDQRIDAVAQDEHVWHPLENIARAPLPAPVKKLLLQLRGGMGADTESA
jgi:A/G-specific adenine glycosylase